MGRRIEALTTIEQSVKIYRDLAIKQPKLHDAALSLTLNNLAAELSELGHNKEALQPIEESLALRQTLAELNPAIYLPEVAMSLNNKYKILSDLP